jgi:hypothetical protein
MYEVIADALLRSFGGLNHKPAEAVGEGGLRAKDSF